METSNTPPDAIALLLLEDDPPIRRRLYEALVSEPRFMVYEAESVVEARALLASRRFDAMLADLNLPDGSSIPLIRETKEKPNSPEVLVVSVFHEEQVVLEAIEAGASGYVLKDAMPADIVETMHATLRGESILSSRIARFILRRMREQGEVVSPESAPTTESPVPSSGSGKLTQRELEVLWGIAKGMKYSEIAESLGISNQTVPTHVKGIFRKLKVQSRGEAVYEAIRQDLIQF